MKILGREPTLYLAVISAVISLIATFGLQWLTPEQAALIVVAINGLFAAFNALFVRPISPVAFTYAVGAIFAVATSYGLQFTPEQVSTTNLVVVAILGLLSRGQVSPVSSSVTNKSVDPTPEAAKFEADKGKLPPG